MANLNRADFHPNTSQSLQRIKAGITAPIPKCNQLRNEVSPLLEVHKQYFISFVTQNLREYSIQLNLKEESSYTTGNHLDQNLI